MFVGLPSLAGVIVNITDRTQNADYTYIAVFEDGRKTARSRFERREDI